MASAIPGLDVTELEQIDPKTLRPRMAGSPPTAPAQMPSAGGMRRMVETVGQRLRDGANYVNGTAPQPGSTPAPATGLRGVAQTASNAAGKALRVGGGLATAYQPARDAYDVARDANTSKLDVATQTAEGVGKGTAAWLGMQGGAAAGAAAGTLGGPLAPVTVPVGAALGGIGGGVAGYYGADKAIKSLRGAFGMDERSPLERIQARQGAASIHAIPPAAQAAIAAAKPPAAGPAPEAKQFSDPRDAGPHPDLNGPLASVPKALPPGVTPGAVYKTRDASGNVTYSGKDVKEGATIADGMGRPTGQLDSGNAPGPATGGMDALNRELTSLRELGTARAAADPGWGGGAAGMGPSLRDIERKNAETTASSIDPRTARRGERQIDGMDKQDITTTQANAQRYGADAGLRGHMYAADQQLKGTLVNANAQSLRTQMEMQFKNGNRALMAQIYQKAGGDLAMAKKMALANGLDPQTFEQALAADQASTARTQDTQAQASDRVRADLKSFVADKDGKMAEDPSGSQAKFDAIRQVFPGITGTDPAYYDQHSPKIKSLAGIYDKARTMPKMGVDALNPFSTADTPLSSMPDWKGGTLTRASGLRGPLTPGIANGDYYMTTKDGRDIPLGQLDEAQVGLIREHTKTGKWHNK
jgi:hypothetical protein